MVLTGAKKGGNGKLYFASPMGSLDITIHVFNSLPGRQDTVIRRFHFIHAHGR